MDRTNNSSSLQSNSSQSKSLIQSLTDPSVSGRQIRYNASRRRNDSKNPTKGHSSAASAQPNAHFGRQSKGGRPRGSGAVANVFDCDVGSDHLNQLSDKLDNKKTFGQKKHNLNHLLNFTFDAQRVQYRSDGKRGQLRGQRPANRYNKEHFLQANCQFIVNDLNDYSIHSSDPDTAVDWNSIEEIRFNSLTAETYCPICLDSPVAPKMTRCGHIFCWSCVLHYLALSDQKWRKCPICFDWIQSDDLRTVSSVSKIDYKIEDFITLCLMKRRKGSTISSPVLLYDSNKNGFGPLGGDPVLSSYQKILIASPNQVLTEIIERERKQLMTQMAVDGQTPEVCFIENALDSLKLREDNLWKRCQQSSGADSGRKPDLNANVKIENKEMSDSDEDYYYFYQSEDGQQIYLHSLNVRILKHEFGSLYKSPTKLCARIIETEWESMSEELRKRHRYLQHLPLTCEFRIVELEFDSDFISKPTLDLFRPEVIRRQKLRSKRAREERRRERHIQVEQNKRIHGIYPRPKYRLDNLQQFPTCRHTQDTSDAQRSLSPLYSSESSTIDDFPLTNQSKDGLAGYGTSPPSAEAEFPSFAAMLREGKAKPVVRLADRKSIAINDNSSYGSDEEYQRPNYNYSLCDAFEAALELKSSEPQNEAEGSGTGGGKKNGSKKKNKPKLLMSTGMKRSY